MSVLVKLAVSRAAWDEIAARIRQARQEDRVSYARGSIDMSEIALVVATEDITPTYTKRAATRAAQITAEELEPGVRELNASGRGLVDYSALPGLAALVNALLE